MIYLILILLLILLFWYYSNKLNNDSNSINDLFMSNNEIIQFIYSDEDNYFNNLSPADLFARKINNITDYKKNIINNIYKLSKKEKKKINKII